MNQEIVILVEKAAEARGEPKIPRHLIVKALGRIERGEEKEEKMTDSINWDKILEETMKKLYADKEFRDIVKHARTGENLSLSELSKKVGVSEDALNGFEQGEQIDHIDQTKISMWFFETEKEKIADNELKDKFELCYLLCKFVLYGSNKQWERFFKFIKSLPK